MGFAAGHERLKNAVHAYWRKNPVLSPRTTAGKVVMGTFYFSIPVVLGYALVAPLADRTEAAAGERLAAAASGSKSEGSSGRPEKVGAGGWGGGVRLAESSARTQEINKTNLERFLKKQRRLKEDREREQQASC